MSNNLIDISDLEMKAKQGDINAQYNLGYCYRYGKGCKKNKVLAQTYFRSAAMQNNKDAQYELAILLRDKGDTEFWHWFCCAYINGDGRAINCLNGHLERAKDNAWTMKEKLDQLCLHISKNGAASVVNKDFLNSIDPSIQEGCYIATAIYGSYDAPQVKILRQYRDQKLLQSKLGTAFVKVYYLLSPPIAKRLKDAKWINSKIKKVLDIFVKTLEQ